MRNINPGVRAFALLALCANGYAQDPPKGPPTVTGDMDNFMLTSDLDIESTEIGATGLALKTKAKVVLAPALDVQGPVTDLASYNDAVKNAKGPGKGFISKNDLNSGLWKEQ